MDPKDFLETASLLVSCSRESDLRTSISRSYYAVVLFYRNYIAQKVGFPPERLSAGVHKFVPDCFNQSNSSEAKKIGAKIDRFRADRNRADYELSKTVDSLKAKDCFQSAKELISCSISKEMEDAVTKQASLMAKAAQLIK